MEIVELAELRRRKRLSQAKLGLAVIKRLKQKAKSEGYAQKIASIWERGESLPTDKHVSALAAILEVSEAQIRQALALKQSSIAAKKVTEGEKVSLAITLFQGLEPKSLVIACFSSPPVAVASAHAPLFDAVVEAVKRGNSFGLVVPYPNVLKVDSIDRETRALETYYSAVRVAVERYAIQLRDAIGSAGESRIAVFAPKAESALVPLPPYWNRQVLVMRSNGKAHPPSELYLWVRIQDLDALRPAVVEPPGTPFTEHAAWEAYFSQVISCWRVKKSFANCPGDIWQKVDLNH